MVSNSATQKIGEVLWSEGEDEDLKFMGLFFLKGKMIEPKTIREVSFCDNKGL